MRIFLVSNSFLAYLSDIENLRSLLASKDQDEMESQKTVELELYSKADNLSKAQAEVQKAETLKIASLIAVHLRFFVWKLSFRQHD